MYVSVSLTIRESDKTSENEPKYYHFLVKALDFGQLCDFGNLLAYIYSYQ